MRKHNDRTGTRGARVLAAILTAMLVLGTAGCDDAVIETPEIAEYGNFGAQYARKLALDAPRRGPYTDEERKAADILREAFEKLDYEPTVERFTVTREDGTVLTSQNVSVRIPGTGFRIQHPDTGAIRQIHRQVIIGAHYDTWFSEPRTDEEGNPIPPLAGADYDACVAARDAGYDGINDNASGIGAMLTLAREMAGNTYGYDVVLVAFGAGCDGQAGAIHFVSGMTPAEVAQTDAMYCIEAIYAGDKLYASAGLNSLSLDKNGNPAKVYEKRRKLYEATDVAIAYDLDMTSYDLLTNQSSIETDLNGDGVADIYREVTRTVSDYSPFDAAGIPCVYIESYNYAFDTLEEMKDSRNPEMSPYGGVARRNNLDSHATLSGILADNSILVRRVNVTAFLLLESIVKGHWEALP